MSRPSLAAISLLPLVLLPGCQRDGESVRNVVLTGSYSMAPLIRDMGQRFEAAHPGVRIDVQALGTDRGIADTRQGLADVGMAARPARPDENHFHVYPIARDGLCLIVNRNNLVQSLSNDQVTRLYTRRILSWKDVGGRDASILLVHWADGRAARTLFLEYFKLQTSSVRANERIGDNSQGIRAVRDNSNAIAYVSIGAAALAARDTPIRLLPLSGIAANRDNLRNGTYPLARSLNLLTRDQPQGLVKDFLDFAQSAAVNDLIEKYHYVPLGP